MKTILRGLAAALLLLLAACGGDGGGEATLGAAGGRVEGPQGASVTVPAGALASDTPIALAASADGAPPPPAGGTLAGDIFAFTPHGTRFAQPVTVRLPVASAPAGLSPRLFKTNAAGAWEAVPGAVVAGGFVSAEVSSFSWFAFFAVPPQITVPPQPQRVTEPATATFTVGAIGSPPFSYRWQRSADGLVWTDIAGAGTDTLAYGPTTLADNGLRVRAIVANPDGPSTSTAALLTVDAAPPVITRQPADVAAAPGADASFDVQATGSGLAYQWERSNDAGASWQPLANETNASLRLSGVQVADSGAQLRVRVGPPGAFATSRAATLTVTAPLPPRAGGQEIAAGFDLSFARRADGVLMAWGGDGNGGLGDGLPYADRGSPGPVTLAAVRHVAAAGRKGAAVDAAGVGWAWGSNGFGEAGIGRLDNVVAPTPVVGASPASRFQAVAVGADHVLWLRTDGRIEAAGFNGTGALGQPDTLYLSQVLLELPGGAAWTAVAAGNNLSLAVRADGTVWTWGSNCCGQQGRDPAGANPVGSLHRIPNLPDAPRAIAAGHRHALAVDASGRVWSWGESANGKLGTGQPAGRWAPPTLLALPGHFIAVAAGAEHSLALRDDGVVFAWGIDETGQLGQGRPLGMSPLPLPVPGLPPARAIAAGWGLGHSLAVGTDGSVWTWGRNDFGQLGRNGRSDSATPAAVPGLNLN